MIFKNEAGLTIVEVVISITLVVSFISILAIAYGHISSGQENLRRQSIATSIARSNLSKYKIGADLSCNSTDEIENLLDDSSENKQTPPDNGFINFSQSVTAQFTRGCDMPPTLISSVSYGIEPNRHEVSVAEYGR